MGMRLHRYRRVFRSRRLSPRIIGWTALAAAIIAVGFFGAKHFTENPLKTEPESVISGGESASIPESVPQTP